MRRILSVRGGVVLFIASAFALSAGSSVLSAVSPRDEVLFRNGLKLVGEIWGLEKGELSFKTDAMGTITVKWAKVVGLYSPAHFRVELGTGQILFGSFERAAEEGKAVIATATGKVLMALDLIVGIDPYEKRGLDRLRGELSAGFSLQRAQKLTTLTVGAQFSYQTSKWTLNLGGSSYLSDQEAVGTTSRNDVALTVQRDLKNRYVALGTTGFQQNTELNLSSRVIMGGGLGNRLVYSNFMILTVGAGAVAVTEKYTDETSSSQSAEAIFMGQLSAFRRTSPKLDILVSTKVFPSLTDWGRVRVQFDTSFSYEIFSDFYVGLDGFYTFDSRPPTTETSKQDYGISASVRWKFNK